MGGVDIGQQSGGVDELPHQCDLVQQYIAEAQGMELHHVPVQVCYGVLHRDLDVGSPGSVLRRHIQHGLPEQGGLSRATQAEEQAYTVVCWAIEVVGQSLVAVPFLPAPNILGQRQ